MIVGILQARLSSRRLPGKVLKPIVGKPMLLLQVERLQRAKRMDQLVVATSDRDEDSAIAVLCDQQGVACFRGSLNDVLDRYEQAAIHYKADHIVRLTGDCPLADPALIDQVIVHHLEGDFDYTSNVLKPTFPDGLDVEVMKRACLHDAWEKASLLAEREHVTRFIRQHPECYTLGSFEGEKNLSHLRWTVDQQEDFNLIKAIYEDLYFETPAFDSQVILSWLSQHPEWATLNAHYHHNAGSVL